MIQTLLNSRETLYLLLLKDCYETRRPSTLAAISNLLLKVLGQEQGIQPYH